MSRKPRLIATSKLILERPDRIYESYPRGQGCVHLHRCELQNLALRGYNPDELVGIDSDDPRIPGGLPCYWTDEEALLIHPREVARWELEREQGEPD
jgi:hypothetical protein